jgi:hypothetical protein
VAKRKDGRSFELLGGRPLHYTRNRTESDRISQRKSSAMSACLFVYLFISSKALSRSSAPALHCSPRSPTRSS